MLAAPFLLPVIYFHRVTADDPHYTNCPPHAFEAFARAAREECVCLSYAQALALLDAGLAPPPNALMITFDDGYKDLLDHALPLLADLGLPSLVFAISGFLGKRALWNPRLADCAEHLSGADLRRLLDAGVEVGSHSVSHVPLPGATWRRQRFEVETSRRALEDELGAPVSAFAYPYGACDGDSALLVEANYRIGFGTVKSELCDWRRGGAQLRRMFVRSDDPVASLRRVMRDATPTGVNHG